MKTILNTNPYIFVQDIVSAIKEGFLVENSNRGWVMNGVLKEINLYKDKHKEFEVKPYGKSAVSSYNAQEFLLELQDYVLSGAVVDIDSLYWDSMSLKQINVERLAPEFYSKDELLALDWKDLKDECLKVGVKGRDKTLLIRQYLVATKQLLEDDVK
jgi:hypothetical protein